MMKTLQNFRARLVVCGLIGLGVLLGTSYGHEDHAFESGVSTAQKPWTHLNFLDDPNDFQFVIVTDRTGSPRRGVFESAIPKINWLRPEFVMSVGDLIKGNSPNAKTNRAEWDEFMGMIEPLEMPFFFLAGNHDIQAKPQSQRQGRVGYEAMRKEWEDRFGTTYYYYVYKNVLFLTLFSNDGIEQQISEEQIAYFREVLKERQDVRWTMVFLHHPLWLYSHDSNFGVVEEMLQDRDYTVVAGHQHRYLHAERNERNYYVLATTGGGSELRGTQFGEFDHVTWVTMTDEGPVMANLKLDGILPHDVTSFDDLKRMLSLTGNASIDSHVLLDRGDDASKGTAFLSLRNDSEANLQIDGSFRHNHYVSPSPGFIKTTLGPGETRMVEVDLRVVEAFDAHDGHNLEFVSDFSLLSGDEVLATVKGSNTIALREMEFDLMGSESRVFVNATRVSMRELPESATIRYTLDGSEPDRNSKVYKQPFTLNRDAVVKSRLFTRSGLGSPISECRFERVKAGNGLLCDYFEYEAKGAHAKILPDFHSLTPALTVVAKDVDPNAIARRERSVGMVFYGYIDIPSEGSYDFHLASDDGARLLVDDQVVIDDPIKHPPRRATGSIDLKSGKNRFELQYFQFKDEMVVDLDYTLPNGQRRKIPSSAFSFDALTKRDPVRRSVGDGLE